MADPGPGPPLAEARVGDLLARLAAPGPDPGGGGAAAVVVALAAALCAMVAELSPRHCADAPRLADEARALARRAPALGDDDARAYRAVLAAGGSGTAPGEDAAARLDAALSAASDVPLAIAQAGAAVARLGARLAREGNPAVQGDAVAAALLGAAGCDAAATLVGLNLADHPDDPRHREAAAARHEARGAAARARGAPG
ncbi:MAG TPA: cyclodeaminase/cyclohydrolase family protein [Acidimicrobiales bacterium]|nr:cyclodeaminase/cyclohydrolase family protein [Acidimicrobiales bacterium]